jgi:acetyl esterase
LKYTTDITPLLDPELVEGFSKVPASDGTFDPASRRALGRMFAAEYRAKMPPLTDIDIRDHGVPASANSPAVPVRVLSPRNRRGTGVLLWMHGGGFFTGHHEDEDLVTAPWVRELGITVVSVGYRMTPEHPWPAATDDCWQALQWIASPAQPLGFEPAALAVGGISAGGCLAAATAIRARDENGPALCLQFLLVPCTDNRSATPSMRALDDRRQWHRDANRLAWSIYAGGDGEVDPMAAPARSTTLEGLAPAYIEAAGADPLRDEAVDYAMRLMQADVPTELHVFPGSYHASTYLQPQAAISCRARAEASAVLQRHLTTVR